MNVEGIDPWIADFVRQVSPIPMIPEPSDLRTLPLRTPDELERYLWETFGVRVPKVRVCPNHQAPWEAFCAAYFATAERSVIVIKGSRGLAGKSWLLALLGTVIATTLRGDVTILGGSGSQSTRVHRAMAKFWAAPNAPRDLLAGQSAITRTTFKAGQVIEALTASQRSARGPHPIALLLDECLAGWTMVATPDGPCRIDQLHRGDVVVTATGCLALVSRVLNRGRRPVVKVTTDAWRAIWCTANHAFLTDVGWVHGENLQGRRVYTLIQQDSGPSRDSASVYRVAGVQDDLAADQSQVSLADDPLCGYATVTRVEQAGDADVWDITVPDGGTFIAEGLVTHNCDEMDLALFEAAMGQTMSANGFTGRTVISSTHQYADGTMTAVLRRAQERGWPVFTWCFAETVEPHGWLPMSEVIRKRSELSAEMWRVEVELGEPSIEGRAIMSEKVERMFLGPPIESEVGGEFAYREFEPPTEGASYVHGADWARSHDYVAMLTLRQDVMPMRVVAYQQFRRKPTPYILRQWQHQTTRYPGTGMHDSTSLGGRLMDDLINPEGLDVVYEGLEMVGRRRQHLFTDYILAIEHEELISPRIVPLYDQHRYVRNDDLRPGGSGHPPDGFVAAALAYRASDRSSGPLALVQTDAPPDPFTHGPAGSTGLPGLTGVRRALRHLSTNKGNGNG